MTASYVSYRATVFPAELAVNTSLFLNGKELKYLIV